jgi:hypothetical protein
MIVALRMRTGRPPCETFEGLFLHQLLTAAVPFDSAKTNPFLVDYGAEMAC